MFTNLPFAHAAYEHIYTVLQTRGLLTDAVRAELGKARGSSGPLPCLLALIPPLQEPNSLLLVAGGSLLEAGAAAVQPHAAARSHPRTGP